MASKPTRSGRPVAAANSPAAAKPATPPPSGQPDSVSPLLSGLDVQVHLTYESLESAGSYLMSSLDLQRGLLTRAVSMGVMPTEVLLEFRRLHEVWLIRTNAYGAAAAEVPLWPDHLAA